MNGPSKTVDPAGLMALSWRVKESAEFDPSSYARDVEKQSPLQGILSSPGARTALAGLGVAGAGGLGYLAGKGRQEANKIQEEMDRINQTTPAPQAPPSRPPVPEPEYQSESGLSPGLLANSPGNALMAAGGLTGLAPIFGQSKEDVIRRVVSEESDKLPLLADLTGKHKKQFADALERKFLKAQGPITGGGGHAGMMQREIERIMKKSPEHMRRSVVSNPEILKAVEAMQGRLGPDSADMRRALALAPGKAGTIAAALFGTGLGMTDLAPQGVGGGIAGGALSQLSPQLIKALGGKLKGRGIAGGIGAAGGAALEDLVSDDSAILKHTPGAALGTAAGAGAGALVGGASLAGPRLKRLGAGADMWRAGMGKIDPDALARAVAATGSAVPHPDALRRSLRQAGRSDVLGALNPKTIDWKRALRGRIGRFGAGGAILGGLGGLGSSLLSRE